MKCADAHILFDELLDGTLGLPQRENVEQHIEECPACRRALDDERALRAALRALPVEPMQPGFGARALANARRHHARTHRHGFVSGFATAAAAGLVMWLAVGVMRPTTDATQAAPELALAVNQPRTVELAFNAPQDLHDVTLTMDLPANVELAGHPGKRTLSWRTTLARGANLLSLPVIAHGGNGGELIATLSWAGQKKSFHIRVDVNEPHASNSTAPGRSSETV